MSHWTENEVDLTVSVYFKMLKMELSGESYSKAEYRRNLKPLLANRSEAAIEFKNQNISAALIKLGQPYIKGYLPRYNYQQILDEKVIEYLFSNSEIEYHFKEYADREIAKSNKPQKFESMLVKAPSIEIIHESKPSYSRNPIKINYLEREQQNTELGYLGENLIYNYEKWNLIKHGKEKLAEEIRWVSKEDGDGAGFDIYSKTYTGEDKFIEVKTTKLGSKTPFYFSHNEFSFSNENASKYYMYRIFSFEENPKFFMKNGGLEDICQYKAVKYKGFF